MSADSGLKDKSHSWKAANRSANYHCRFLKVLGSVSVGFFGGRNVGSVSWDQVSSGWAHFGRITLRQSKLSKLRLGKIRFCLIVLGYRSLQKLSNLCVVIALLNCRDQKSWLLSTRQSQWEAWADLRTRMYRQFWPGYNPQLCITNSRVFHCKNNSLCRYCPRIIRAGVFRLLNSEIMVRTIVGKYAKIVRLQIMGRWMISLLEFQLRPRSVWAERRQPSTCWVTCRKSPPFCLNLANFSIRRSLLTWRNRKPNTLCAASSIPSPNISCCRFVVIPVTF